MQSWIAGRLADKIFVQVKIDGVKQGHFEEIPPVEQLDRPVAKTQEALLAQIAQDPVRVNGSKAESVGKIALREWKVVPVTFAVARLLQPVRRFQKQERCSLQWASPRYIG